MSHDDDEPPGRENRAHLLRSVAKMKRRLLVDHARRRRATKQNARPAAPVLIPGLRPPDPRADMDLLALDAALSALAEVDPRAAEIVEMRYIVGATVEEVAKALNISEATVRREWLVGKMFLRRRMRGLST